MDSTKTVTRRGSLSREAIVAAALVAIERDGLDALSMRRLGAELGVEAPSLYHHIPSRQALLDGVIEHVAAKMELTWATAEGAWDQRLADGFRAYRRLAHDHPAVFPLLGRRPVRTLATLRPIEAALRVLADAGFTPAKALSAFRVLSSYTYGYALSELSGLAIDDVAAGVESPTADVAAEVPAFPALAAALPAAREIDPDTEFDAGLATIIRGLTTPSGDPRA